MSRPPGDFRTDVPEDVVGWGNAIADNLGPLLKEKGWGFTLLMFEYNDNPAKTAGAFWISTAQRADMIASLQEFIRKQANA